MYLSNTDEQEGWFEKEMTHNRPSVHEYTVMTLCRQIHLLYVWLVFFSRPSLLFNTEPADINIWAFEPWKLIIYERIDKVPVVLKAAWKSNKTELMLLEFLLTSWHYLDDHRSHLKHRTRYNYWREYGIKMSGSRIIEERTERFHYLQILFCWW